jgi:hypothetical protein
MDAEEFDASELLKKKVIEEDIKKNGFPNGAVMSKLCSKIIYFDKYWYKAKIKGDVDKDGEFSIKLTALCEDSSISVKT